MTHRTPLTACWLLLALAGLAACDPGGSSGPDGTEDVAYLRSPCGSVAPTAATPSSDVDAPTSFEVGSVVGGRIDPESLSNDRHFWEVDLDRGSYHLVVDETTAPNDVTNVGLVLNELDSAGVEIERLNWVNEIDRRVRSHHLVSVSGSTRFRFEVAPNHGMEDYLLGVFDTDTEVPSPFFEDCPTFVSLAMGVATEVDLEDEGSIGDEQWLTFDADIGDYQFVVDATRRAGTSSNIQYELLAFDRLGQVERAEQILWANEIDRTVRLTGSLSVGEPTAFWIRARNNHEATLLSILVNPE